MPARLRLSEAGRSELVAFLQDLVRLPSPSTQERQVAERLAQEMREAGLDVSLDEMGNVIGHVGRGKGPALCYNGHMDTVEIGDPGLWKHDPFGAEVRDGLLYGLGAADMKGGLAAMVHGVKALIRAGGPPKGDLYLVGVVQEEPCEGLAMRYIMESGRARADMVILGEPTHLGLALGHRGRLGLRVRVHGRAAHASMPELGQNAIYDAAKAVVAVELLAPQLGRGPFLGPGTIAVTQIASRSASLNAIPDLCELYVDRRLTAGETEAKALAELKRSLAREGVRAEVEVTEYRAASYTGHPCQAKEYFPAWTLPENAPLVAKCAQVVEAVLGRAPELGCWAFSTDGAYTAGSAGIPTVGFGPGEERYAHAADERVRVADVCAAAEVYANLPLALLG